MGWYSGQGLSLVLEFRDDRKQLDEREFEFSSIPEVASHILYLSNYFYDHKIVGQVILSVKAQLSDLKSK